MNNATKNYSAQDLFYKYPNINWSMQLALELNILLIFCQTPPIVRPIEFKTRVGKLLCKILTEHWRKTPEPIAPACLITRLPPMPNIEGVLEYFFASKLDCFPSLLPDWVKMLRAP
jgi:hypothetical protein